MRKSALAIPLAVAALTSQLDRTIVPGERIGPISAATSEADLNELFGSDAVAVAEIYLSEGVCSPGAVVLPATPDRLEITWADSARSRIAFIRIAGEGSGWRTVRGVGVGTSLMELESIKGRSVEFTGFEWDFGGAMHWPAGTVERGEAAEPQVLLLMDPHLADGAVPGAELDTANIFGDIPVRSDHPIIRRLDITVREMIVSWDHPYEQSECETEPTGHSR